MSNPSYILLGSNINPKENMRLAFSKLKERFNVTQISHIYETKPIKKQNVDNYLNAVVEVLTELDPVTIKYEYLRKIEHEMGRKRTRDKFKPRVIDLDLIDWCNEVFESKEHNLILPDPEIIRYAHIAVPLADLSPNYYHHSEDLSIDQILKRLDLGSIQKIDLT